MTETLPFKIGFAVTTDEDGVVDGRILAREIMLVAYRLLSAYVDGDPSKVDQMFRAMTYETFMKMQVDRAEQETDDDQTEIVTRGFPDKAQEDEAFARHKEKTHGFTDMLLSYPVEWVVP